MPAGAGSGSVFLLTDYGHSDELAGVLRAVVCRNAPDARVVDLTHDVAPFDVRAGALTLARATSYLGPGVVVAVVDPGVGTSRRAIAVEVPQTHDSPRFFVGPDNGLLGFALDLVGGPTAAVMLAPSPMSSRGISTFDGRDVFAPAAARLWSGEALAALGEPVPVDQLVRLVDPHLVVRAGGLEAEVLWVDRFGNVQLVAAPSTVPESVGAFVAHVSGTTVSARRVSTFAALAAGELGVMVDANEKLSLVCNQQSAATVLGVAAGDIVTLEYQGSTLQ